MNKKYWVPDVLKCSVIEYIDKDREYRNKRKREEYIMDYKYLELRCIEESKKLQKMIRAKRKKVFGTQRDISDKTGLDKGAISQIELGVITMSRECVELYLKAIKFDNVDLVMCVFDYLKVEKSIKKYEFIIENLEDKKLKILSDFGNLIKNGK